MPENGSPPKDGGGTGVKSGEIMGGKYQNFPPTRGGTLPQLSPPSDFEIGRYGGEQKVVSPPYGYLKADPQNFNATYWGGFRNFYFCEFG